MKHEKTIRLFGFFPRIGRVPGNAAERYRHCPRDAGHGFRDTAGRDDAPRDLRCGPAVPENIADTDKPARSGAMLNVIPMDIRGGTGAPARVVAIHP
ncbi:hypothetical protein [Methanoregula sp. PtaB.Bin085]|uniref:hypothetical protein n=1 Tax=Methanoregula sp. PtaB.Bin085 TaxID=1811680 RepID=UPI0009D17E82|nr:hypothetical protein [Methanoregula sp. PtaB.Bin085]OPX65007.1 MAG: hypothetical protein A4E33_00447 [Methanoregula sp. PtaB.Bin085]